MKRPRPVKGTCNHCMTSFAISAFGRVPIRCPDFDCRSDDLTYDYVLETAPESEPEPEPAQAQATPERHPEPDASGVCLRPGCEIPVNLFSPMGEWCIQDWRRIPVDVRGTLLVAEPGSPLKDVAVLKALRALRVRDATALTEEAAAIRP